MAAKLTSIRGGKKGSGSPPAPRTGPAPIGDNSQHGEEAERVQLISIVSQLSAAEDAIEVAKAPLKAAQKKRSQIIGLGKAAGFTARELSARLDEMRMGTREMAQTEAREHKHRRWLGIIEPDQSKLILGDAAPQEAKDEAHWRGEGFKAGLRQLIAKPAPECPERFVQGWLQEHERGLQQVLTANAPKTLSVREQAAADFAEEHPEWVDPASPEGQAAERKAVRLARESLEAMSGEPEDPAEALEPATEEVV